MVRRFVEIGLDINGNPIVLDLNEIKRHLNEDHSRLNNFKLFKGKDIIKDKEFVL